MGCACLCLLVLACACLCLLVLACACLCLFVLVCDGDGVACLTQGKNAQRNNALRLVARNMGL